jgi:hypothetical protein
LGNLDELTALAKRGEENFSLRLVFPSSEQQSCFPTFLMGHDSFSCPKSLGSYYNHSTTKQPEPKFPNKVKGHIKLPAGSKNSIVLFVYRIKFKFLSQAYGALHNLVTTS